MFCEKNVLKNFAKLKGKHLYYHQSIKLQDGEFFFEVDLQREALYEFNLLHTGRLPQNREIKKCKHLSRILMTKVLTEVRSNERLRMQDERLIIIIKLK